MSRHNLQHAIKLRFGTSPHEPTDHQLNAIIEDMVTIKKQRTPTQEDWLRVVRRHCPSTGNYLYESEDNSDLNSLLTMIGK